MMSTEQPPVHLRLVKISKRFGSTVAAEGISLDVLEGKFTTLLGPSGCGKTTTLRIIAGIYSPDSGDVFISGQRVTDLPPQKRNTAMVFQEYALFPHMNVYENIGYGLKRRGTPKAQIREKVRWVQEFLGLRDLDKHSINQLSGGQQQRVALARALVLEPSVLLLDEPLSNLDAKIRIKIRTELRQIQQSLGKTTIYVTHDQEEALSISDHIALMDRGRIIQVGTPEEIYYRPVNSFAADFIGNANFVDGTVLEVSEGSVFVDSEFGRLAARSFDTRFKAGEKIRLVIRPESLSLSPGPRGGESDLEGVIKTSSFMGGLTRYWVQLKSGEWIVDVPSAASISPGQKRVWVHLSPEGIHCIRP
jgi:ABC-type Fe3+/spermidine/putrescine transport system ATPase subunit